MRLLLSTYVLPGTVRDSHSYKASLLNCMVIYSQDIVSQLNIPQAFAEHVIRLYSKMEAETEMRKPKEAELKKLFNDAMKQVIKEEMASDKNQEGQSKD